MAGGGAVQGGFQFAEGRAGCGGWSGIDEDIVGGELRVASGGAAHFRANGNLRIGTGGACCGSDEVAGDVMNLASGGLAGAGGKKESQEAKKEGRERAKKGAKVG